MVHTADLTTVHQNVTQTRRTGRHLLLIALLLLVGTSGAIAQTTTKSASDATTPNALAPGAPAGSYPLSGFENINLYNGNLDFHLPLLRLGGRGSAGYAMMLALNTKRWSVRHSSTTSTESWVPTSNSWGDTNAGYGPGRMVGRKSGFDIKYLPACPPYSGGKRMYSTTLTTLTFAAADGTEYQFRDQLNGGQRLPLAPGCPVSPFQGPSRGTVFITSDGSAATFVSDTAIYDQVDIPLGTRTFTPSGYLLLRDGTRYRIDNGNVSWIRDRNGNQVTFNVNGVFATDSLGRNVIIEYGVTDATYGLCDRIRFSGSGGAQRTIYVTQTSLGSVLRAGYALQTYAQLFPELNGATNYGTTPYNPTLVSSVVLPDGRAYQFKYNSYGELARVELPTGGAVEYDMGTGSGVIAGNDGQMDAYAIYRRVGERRTYASGTTLEGRTVYTDSVNNYVAADSYNAGGTLLASERHYFNGGPARGTVIQQVDGDGYPYDTYPPWDQGKEITTEAYNTNGTAATTLLRQVVNSWQAGGTLGGLSINPRLVTTTTTFADANLVTKQSAINPQNGAVGFDQYNNRTDTWEYDYGTGAPPAYPVRHTHIDYLTTNPANGVDYTSYNGAHLRGLPAGQQVYAVNPANGAETLVAQSTTAYDETAYPLIGYGAVSGWSDPGTTARGNATTMSRWLDTTGGWLATHAQYDQTGNVRAAWDALGNQSQVSYADAFSDGVARNTYAFPTSTASAVPDPSNQRGTNTPLTASSVYDYSTGLVTASTDANAKTTTYEYNDVLDRPTKVNRPDYGWTSYEYGRNTYGDYVGVRSAIDAGRNTLAYHFTDGLGRAARSFVLQHDSSDWLTTDTQYDAMGRVWRVSNSYLSGGSPAPINPSGRWTTSQYDALGRVLTVTTPDNAVVSTAYSGNSVTVTDQAGKQRRSVSDALGRLKQVAEDPAGLNYLTDYDYDALGNLRRVNQGGQSRFFMYDSLSRLTRARNPEQVVNGNLNTGADPISGNYQWSLAYGYDNNGNLSSKTDARNVTTSYVYDNINRVKQTSYSDGTPYTLNTYDFATNGRGRFYADYESSTTGTLNFVTAYDAMGRPTARHTALYAAGTGWSPDFNSARTYDLAGNVLSETYPSGHTVTNTYGDAAGRLTQFTGNLGDGAARTYATGITYDEASRLNLEQFGTNTALYHKQHYNVRGQLYDVRLSSVNDEWNWNRGALTFDYGTTGNNGNIGNQQHWVPNDDQISGYAQVQQNYAYDALNRLTGMQEYRAGGGLTLEQWHSYDRWGNRQILDWATNGGVNEQQFTIDAATNRLGAPGQPSAMVYDSAGNLTYDSYTGSGGRTYDAENRMTRAWDNTGYEDNFTYDAGGKRMRRQTRYQTVWQVYGFGGELLAEYNAGAAPTSPQKEYGYRGGELLVTADAPGGGGAGVQWLVADHLGTPRIIADQTGSLAGVKRHDYLPFGEEVGAGVGGRTTAQGYSGDNVRQKFTSKERDGETGLDYFLARYYSSIQGRFTSVDPNNAVGYEDDPQSWHSYVYARNNPLKYQDRDGKKYQVCDANGENCVRVSDEDFYKARSAGEKEGERYTGNRDFYESGRIYVNGEQFYTYTQISIDDQAAANIFAIRQSLMPMQNFVDEAGRRLKNMGKALVGGLSPSLGSESVNGADISTEPSSDVTTLIGVAANVPPGFGKGWAKLRGNQGFRDPDGNMWNKDQMHRDHWDVSDRGGNKVKEVDFNGNQIWPGGPKNKNK